MRTHLLDRLAAAFDRWQAGWNATITPLEVPFQLPVEPVNASTFRVLESGSARQRIASLFAWIFGGIGGTGMLLVFVGLIAESAPFSAVDLVMFFVSASVLLLFAMISRHVASEAPLERVVAFRPARDAMQLLTRRGEQIEQQYAAALSTCRIRIHPISFERWSRWRGFGAVLHMGPHQLVLACGSRRDDIEAYMRGLPAWLHDIFDSDGSVLVGQGFLRAGEAFRLRRIKNPEEAPAVYDNQLV